MPIPAARPTAPASPPRRPAAFIDRDGVINAELDYVHRVADFHVLPGVVDGLRAAARWICAPPAAARRRSRPPRSGRSAPTR